MTDDEIETLAKKHICPHHDRLEAILPNRVPYQQTEQFRRVKALIGDVLSKLRAPVAGEAIGYSTGIQWRPRQSEQTVKLTRTAQPEYGFDHALYTAPQASEAVDRSPNLQGSPVDRSAELQDCASEAVRDAGIAASEDVVRDPVAERDTGKDRLSFHIWALVHGMDITPNDSCGYVSPLTQRAWMRWNPPERAALSAQPGAQTQGGTDE